MPGPLIPIALGVARAAGTKVLQHGAKKLTKQGMQNQAVKSGAKAATGSGLLTATPAQAPTRTNGPDAVKLSPESTTTAPSRPEQANPPLPDLSSWAPHA